MLITYYPEMGEKKPEAKIEAQISHYGRHWFLKTPLAIKGRGIVLVRVLTAEMLVPSAQSKVGWKEYKVTEAAFEKICQAYEVSTECLL